MNTPSSLMLQDAVNAVVGQKNLSEEEMKAAMGLIMDGGADDVHIAALLTGLRLKGESVSEIAGAVMAMRDRAACITPDAATILDTCGTGGDGAGTFNISTAVAFVCAAAGATVAKHGNRAVSSRVGSADVLEALGVRIDLSADAVTQCVNEVGIGFLFAPAHHSALRHAAPVRRKLGFRTILNLLGPMTNPAGATHQLIGVYDRTRVATVANVLGQLGTQKALIVHGEDGLDEISLSAPTHAALLEHGSVSELRLTSSQFGIEEAPVETLAGGDASENAAIIMGIFQGNKGPAADIVRLNAGAAIWVAELTPTLADGVALASSVLAKGEAADVLERLVKKTAALAVGQTTMGEGT